MPMIMRPVRLLSLYSIAFVACVDCTRNTTAAASSDRERIAETRRVMESDRATLAGRVFGVSMRRQKIAPCTERTCADLPATCREAYAC